MSVARISRSSEVLTDVSTTSGDALRLAIKLAVDAGEYERAAAVLDVLSRTTTTCTVTPIRALLTLWSRGLRDGARDT